MHLSGCGYATERVYRVARLGDPPETSIVEAIASGVENFNHAGSAVKTRRAVGRGARRLQEGDETDIPDAGGDILHSEFR
jgi:hypothetical protein